MLMGTAEGKGLVLIDAPKKKFIEDMTADEKQEYYKDILGVASLKFFFKIKIGIIANRIEQSRKYLLS